MKPPPLLFRGDEEEQYYLFEFTYHYGQMQLNPCPHGIDKCERAEV